MISAGKAIGLAAAAAEVDDDPAPARVPHRRHQRHSIVTARASLQPVKQHHQRALFGRRLMTDD
jgi:hypothetical protein